MNKYSKKLRVVFDASPLLVNKTGVAYYTERLVTQLAEQYPKELELVGFYYNFLGKRSTKHFPQAPNIRYRPVRFIPSKIVYQLRRWGIELPLELLTKGRADFVLFPNFLGYPSLLHTPAAPVVHDLTYIDLPQYVSAKNRSDLQCFVPQQIKRSALVFTVSDFSKQRITEEYGLQPEKIIVTPIPPEKPQRYAQKRRMATLQKTGITKPFILFLGTIEPRKNITTLIDAYAALPEATRNKYMLVIAGRIGWNCEQEITRLKQAMVDGLDVLHVGYVDDETKAILYQSAELFVTASTYEGFGMPVLEAMSYGIASAVSDIPVFREVAGNSAVYFDQTDPQSISKAMQGIISNPDKLARLKKAAIHRVATYDWASVARDVYEAIVASSVNRK